MIEELCRPQTIRGTLTAHGFRFDKRLGQNFLIADWVPRRMADYFSKGQAVLEVGPGFGALTAALAQTCSSVAAVEKDRRLIPVLTHNLSGFGNVRIIEGDALKLDLTALEACAVCANLPYSVTSPLLARLLEAKCFNPVIVMVQREVAHRLAAEPGTPEYGAFTVFSALHARCTLLFDVEPDCFMPRPAVTSTVIRLERLAPDTERESLVPQALRLSKAAFAQRRKTLLNAISSGLALPREVVEQKLTAAGISPSARGETLPPEMYLKLSRFF